MDVALQYAGEISALAVVLWLVLYDHKILIPRLVREFTQSLIVQRTDFAALSEKERDVYRETSESMWKNYTAELRVNRRESEGQSERFLALIREYEKIHNHAAECKP